MNVTRVGVFCLAGVVLLTGCSGVRKYIDKVNQENESYYGLQSFIRDQLTTKFHRSVRSVSCTPHVDQVLPGTSSNLRCLVRFANGSSYTAQATISDPSSDPDTAVNDYSFQDPPGVDITTAPLPAPTVTLSATSPGSLFDARNLAPLIRRLEARVGRRDLLIQLAIYPGELIGVVARTGQARAVSAAYTGALTVGPSTTFDGSRSGIGFPQLVPGVIQRLDRQIAARGGVKRADIGRFVLTSGLPHGNAGWTIYLRTGARHFQALVLGQNLHALG
jgi:hypothetical protein